MMDDPSTETDEAKPATAGDALAGIWNWFITPSKEQEDERYVRALLADPEPLTQRLALSSLAGHKDLVDDLLKALNVARKYINQYEDQVERAIQRLTIIKDQRETISSQLDIIQTQQEANRHQQWMTRIIAAGMLALTLINVGATVYSLFFHSPSQPISEGCSTSVTRTPTSYEVGLYGLPRGVPQTFCLDE